MECGLPKLKIVYKCLKNEAHVTARLMQYCWSESSQCFRQKLDAVSGVLACQELIEKNRLLVISRLAMRLANWNFIGN